MKVSNLILPNHLYALPSCYNQINRLIQIQIIKKVLQILNEFHLVFYSLLDYCRFSQNHNSCNLKNNYFIINNLKKLAKEKTQMYKFIKTIQNLTNKM